MKKIIYKLMPLVSAIICLYSCGEYSDSIALPIYAESHKDMVTEPLPLEECLLTESEGVLNKLLTKNLKKLLPSMVAIPTVRTDSLDTPEEIEKMQKLKNLMDEDVENFNKNNTNKLVPFEWKKVIDDKPFWVFGYRLGEGEKKIGLITHVDVVPASKEGAFELKCENREYQNIKQPFLVGRGALDDKGPTISTLSAVQALAHEFSAKSLENVTIELVIDTSEEVELGAHHYFADAKGSYKPDFGIVVDAAWCTFAEKGIERPIFSFPKDKEPKKGLWIESISVPKDNPTNVIPDFAEARIKGKNTDDINELNDTVEGLYKSYAFDDPDYRKAKLEVSKDNDTLVLRTEVLGAQHGSAPQENRALGANPVVSLLNFLAHLFETDVIGQNAYTDMAVFVKDTFGTTVFGEKHPDLLQKADSIFKKQEKNGTTYAITNVNDDDTSVKLLLDVRYALDHHQCGWDGKTFGTLQGKSVFRDAFEELVNNFNTAKSTKVVVQTKTVVGPDIKDTTSDAFVKVDDAFKKVMKTTCPLKAIGGATDAKGEASLITAGALFDFKFGYPTYYHGKSEGVPVNDIYKTSEILFELLKKEIGKVAKKKPSKKPFLRLE